MGRGFVIALASLGLAAPALAQAERSPNPFDVTWDVDAPSAVKPLPFSLDPRADIEVRALRLHMHSHPVDPGPSIAADVWDGETRFPACNSYDPACANNPQGVFGLRLRDDGDGGLKLGALVRLGESLQEPRSSSKNAWRFFAAADAQAVTWDFNRNDGESFRVEDLLTIGDAQIGIARPLAGGDLALGFIHREISVEGASRTEQFAGVTFTMEH